LVAMRRRGLPTSIHRMALERKEYSRRNFEQFSSNKRSKFVSTFSVKKKLKNLTFRSIDYQYEYVIEWSIQLFYQLATDCFVYFRNRSW